MNATVLRVGAYAAALLTLGASAAYTGITIGIDDPIRPSKPLRLAEVGLSGMDLTGAVDVDHDGVSDLEENYVWGSDPENLSTIGLGVPDGWLARHGFDPTNAGLSGWTLPLPADVPAPLAHQDLRVGLLELYAFGRPGTWSESRDGPWLDGLSPHNEKTTEGLAVAWLLRQGLDPREPGVGSRRLGEDGQTVAENYRQGTDPHRADTDADGLTDADEANRYATDPLRASSRNDGIPDGWLVRWGLDPADPAVASATFDGKGLTVMEVFQYNDARVGRVANLAGAGLNPRLRCHHGCGVPDGWLVQSGLDPLEASTSGEVLRRASNAPDARFLDAGVGSLPAIPDRVLTVRDAYQYGRPSTWNEGQLGPWRGGLDPSEPDVDGDGLDDVLEIRGWYVNRTLGTGPQSVTSPIFVASDPKLRDTDADGLDDAAEYHGRITVGLAQRRFSASDPTNPDTAFSGLADGEKVLGVKRDGRTHEFVRRSTPGNERVLLEPNRTDTDADGLRDGDEFGLWLDRSSNAIGPYQSRFPHAAFANDIEWVGRLPWVQAQGLVADSALAARILAPEGDVDADGLPNLLDADSDNDALLDGWETLPHLYSFTDFASPFPRPSTDPANFDTDGDQLPDAWEVRFGEFQPSGARWTLDPSRQRSDGVTPDGDANLDGDVVEWFLYQGADGRLQPRVQSFGFTNLREFQAGTDPRLADQNLDGVPEAWAFFWGTVYPTQVLGGRAGVLAPSPAQLAQQSGRFTVTNPDLGRSTKAPGGEPYHRFAASGPLVLDAEAAERVHSTFTVDRAGERLTVSQIEGRFSLTFADEVELRTNPYLADTDGDGMPDAWEALRRACLDPVTPDDHLDADRDGRANRAEYELPRNAERFGTNPCLSDTDLGGLEDGKESALRRNPLNPVDDAAGAGGLDQDSDGDGLGDAEEILHGLDPLGTDTDRDGLLDGGNLEFVLRPEDPAPPLYEALVAQGAVRVQQAVDGGSRVVVRGEGFVGTDPLLMSTAGDGIPDGWKVAWGISPASPVPQFASKYGAGKPGWWTEALHGVWWWGSPPHAAPTNDLDLDGLDDASGDDPVPAARHGCCGPKAPVSDQGGRTGWLAAQSYGERPGEPLAVRQSWQVADYDGDGILDALDHAPTVTVLESLEQPQGSPVAPDGVVLKGKDDPFWVVGRVKLACGAPWVCVDEPRLRNRVVSVFLGGAESAEPVGVGVTDAEGRFRVEACLCLAHTFKIPEAGIVVRSQDEGEVRWTSDPNVLSVGVRDVFARTSATTATFWNDPSRDAQHPQFLPARGVQHGQPTHTNSTAASSSSSQRWTVASRSLLEIEAPDQLPWTGSSRPLTILMRLTDATGQPIAAQPVVATVDGATIPAPPTDADGKTSVTTPISPNQGGVLGVGAAFAGEAPRYLATTAASRTVVAQGPSQILLGELPASVAAGDALAVGGSLRSGARPVSAAPITAEWLDDAPLPALNGVTDAAGRFEIQLPTTSTMRGPFAVRVRFAGTSLAAPATAEGVTQVLAKSRLLEAPARASLVLAEPFVVEGLLLDEEARPIPGHTVVGTLAGTTLANATTQTGAFRFEFVPSSSDAVGPTPLTIRHPPHDGFAEATLERHVLATSRPRLEVRATEAFRNGTALVRGNLTAARGEPIPGQLVGLRFGAAQLVEAASDAQGAFALPWRVPRNATLGVQRLEVRFPGSQDGLLAPASATLVLLVRDQAQILFEPAPARQPRDAVLVAGALRSPAGARLSNLSVTVSLDGQTLGSVVSGALGEWAVTFRLPANVSAGTHLVRVTTPGNDTVGPATQNTTVATRTPTRLVVVAPPSAGLGASFNVSVFLNETGGPPVGAPRIEWRLGDANGSAVLGPAGRIEVRVPEQAGVGPTPLAVLYPGDAHRDPSLQTRSVTLRAAPTLQIVDTPARVAAGEPFIIRARLVGPDASPLPGELVSLVLGSSELAALVRTDDDGIAQFALTPERDGEIAYGLRYSGSDAFAPAEVATSALAASEPAPRPTSLAAALAIGGAVALLAIAAFAWMRLKPLSGVRSAVWSSYQELVAHDDTSAAILLAYRKLGKALERYGYKERASETPTEFLRGVLRLLPARGDYLGRLADLFNAARYGQEPLEAHHREEAQACLRTALHDLDRLLAGLRLWRMVHGRAAA